ncbi:hypothetical protein Y032_0050g1969 [Ancylostoma ceylanicum]|uniref:Uncharacterized protein n=1 Tax=Ancylostoma ceylanicum TaxID=53326 RepID=A0A016U8E4_9BILA|nr:hypothetical protein Y032_0050g1969 [Ancylostoma ceylanicum]
MITNFVIYVVAATLYHMTILCMSQKEGYLEVKCTTCSRRLLCVAVLEARELTELRGTCRCGAHVLASPTHQT